MLNYQRVTDIGLMMCIDYFQFEKYWVCFFPLMLVDIYVMFTDVLILNMSPMINIGLS